MGLFSGLFGGSADPARAKREAFAAEMERLQKAEKEAREDAVFSGTEGQGISEAASFTFGDEEDLEDLTDEEKLARSTGRREFDTGLIL